MMEMVRVYRVETLICAECRTRMFANLAEADEKFVVYCPNTACSQYRKMATPPVYELDALVDNRPDGPV